MIPSLIGILTTVQYCKNELVKLVVAVMGVVVIEVAMAVTVVVVAGGRTDSCSGG